MKLAFLYAGQGAQKPGMGQDLYDEYPEVRGIFDLRPMGLAIRSLCFDSDMETISRTEHTQPCMGAFAAAVTRLLVQNGVAAQCAMGLSLGEYGALHAAGVLDAGALLDLLAFRGAAMAEASEGLDCGMTAVLNLASEDVERAVAEIGGDVWCCNYNCPGQTVIGGDRADVEKAAARCLELGAKRCLTLNVSGPFHTPFMAPAAEALRGRFQSLALSNMRIPVVFNATGTLLPENETVKNMLVRQVISPVRVEDGIRALLSLGVDTIIEIGPGNALSGFVKKTAPEITTHNISTANDFRTVLEQL